MKWWSSKREQMKVKEVDIMELMFCFWQVNIYIYNTLTWHLTPITPRSHCLGKCPPTDWNNIVCSELGEAGGGVLRGRAPGLWSRVSEPEPEVGILLVRPR